MELGTAIGMGEEPAWERGVQVCGCAARTQGWADFMKNNKSRWLSPGAKGSPAFAGTLPAAEHV